MYMYALKSTGYSSQRFGPCTVCGRHASEVFHQMVRERFTDDEGSFWGASRSLFGHQDCLIARRQKPEAIILKAYYWTMALDMGDHVELVKNDIVVGQYGKDDWLPAFLRL